MAAWCRAILPIVLLSLVSSGAFQPASDGIMRFPGLSSRVSITSSRQHLGMPHSGNNFNPQSSSLVASRPAATPLPRDNLFSSLFFRHQPFPSNNLNNRRIQTNPTGITFGGTNNSPFVISKPSEEHISATTAAPLRVIGDNDRKAAIHFGVGPAEPERFPTNFAIKTSTQAITDRSFESDSSTVAPSTGFNHQATNIENTNRGVPEVFNHVATNINIGNDNKGAPEVFFPGLSDKPILSAIENLTVNTEGNTIDYNNDCVLKSRKTIFEGNCSVLLQRGHCATDQWLILSKENGTAYCAERKCPWDKVYYEGDCVNPRDFDVCRRGQILYVDFTGSAECDCEPDFIYDPHTENCYAEHERGFCPHSYYISRDENLRVTCVPNPCVRDGYVKHIDGKCYPKNYLGRCLSNQVFIIPKDETAECQNINLHSIFDVPTLRTCPPGSRRDFLHKCRTVFRVPTSVSSVKKDCAGDSIRGPRGRCRRVVRLFG